MPLTWPLLPLLTALFPRWPVLISHSRQLALSGNLGWATNARPPAPWSPTTTLFIPLNSVDLNPKPTYLSDQPSMAPLTSPFNHTGTLLPIFDSTASLLLFLLPSHLPRPRASPRSPSTPSRALRYHPPLHPATTHNTNA